jgi:penicillin amidase
MVDLYDLTFSDSEPSLPCLGAPGPLGVVFTQYYSPPIKIPFVKTLTKRYGLVGDSYVAVYEFGPKVRSSTVINFGQSGDPKSPHYFDQARLLSEGKLKPALFEWADVLAGAKTVYHPGEPPVEHVAK